MREIFCVRVCVMGANIFHHRVLAISVSSWQFALYLWHFQQTRALSLSPSFSHTETLIHIHLIRTSFTFTFTFVFKERKHNCPHFFVMGYALAVGRKAATKRKSDTDIFAWCDKITFVFVYSSILSSCMLFKLVSTCVHVIYGKTTMSTRNMCLFEPFSSVQRGIFAVLSWIMGIMNGNEQTNEWMNLVHGPMEEVCLLNENVSVWIRLFSRYGF